MNKYMNKSDCLTLVYTTSITDSKFQINPHRSKYQLLESKQRPL